jgi:Cdc6-like AAA superfamily ATPase
MKSRMTKTFIYLLLGVPGIGKSRLIDDLEAEVKKYVESQECFDQEFKDLINGGVYLTISFGAKTLYSDKDSISGIEKALCSRILNLFGPEYSRFLNNVSFPNLLEFCLTNLSKKSRIIVLCVDEINRLPEDNKSGVLQELINLVGSMSCSNDFLFCVVLAGTSIGRIENMFKKSTYRPLPLPLPLLRSFEVNEIFHAYRSDKKFFAMLIDIRYGWTLPCYRVFVSKFERI